MAAQKRQRTTINIAVTFAGQSDAYLLLTLMFCLFVCVYVLSHKHSMVLAYSLEMVYIVDSTISKCLSKYYFFVWTQLNNFTQDCIQNLYTRLSIYFCDPDLYIEWKCSVRKLVQRWPVMTMIVQSSIIYSRGQIFEQNLNEFESRANKAIIRINGDFHLEVIKINIFEDFHMFFFGWTRWYNDVWGKIRMPCSDKIA